MEQSDESLCSKEEHLTIAVVGTCLSFLREPFSSYVTVWLKTWWECMSALDKSTRQIIKGVDEHPGASVLPVISGSGAWTQRCRRQSVLL